MENRMERVETQQGQMQQDISTLKTDVSVLQKDVSILQKDVSILQKDVSELKTDMSIVKKDISLLQIDVGIIKSNYATREDIARVEGNIEALRGEVYKAISTQTHWFVSALFLLLGSGLGLAKILF